MTGLRLASVRHAVGHDGLPRLTMEYQRGKYEATVQLRVCHVNGHEANCQELPADSVMDEEVLEDHAREWADEHAAALGDVDLE